MSNWSHLHGSMLSLVAVNLTNVNDLLAFSVDCSSWRSVALDIRPTFPCPLPYLMIRGKDDYGYCMSLSHGRILNKKLHIPQGDWYIGSHGGWLVTVHENLDMSLFNPFSKDILPLPSITSVPKFGEGDYNKNNKYVESAALSSSDINVSPKDLIVMLVQGAYGRLAFAKPGDSSWQIIDYEDSEGHFFYSDVTFYQGKFYAVGYRGTVVCEDIDHRPKASLLFPGTNHRPKASLLFPTTCERGRSYLVESRGRELILVERWFMLNEDNSNSQNNGTNDEGSDCLLNERWTYKTMFFIAYKMDIVAQRWAPLEGIGDHQVFFVGFNSAFALRAEIGKGNRIYFTDDYVDGQESEIADYGKLFTRDMGVFNFNDRTIRPHIDIGDAAIFRPPMWAIPLPW